MKVLIVSPFFPPIASVAIVRISSIVRQLKKEGHEITVIRNEYNEDDDQLSTNDLDLLNLKTYKVEVNRSTRFFEASKKYKNIFRKVMDNERFDIVLITAGPFYTIPLCEVAKKEYNTKCIIDYRDLWIFDVRKKVDFFKPINLIKKLIYFPIEKRNIKYADLIVTVTEDWQQILKKVYKTEKVKVIENGYDDVLLNKLNSSIDFPYRDKFVVAIFGKLAYYSVEYGVKFFKAMKEISKEYPDLLVLHIGLPESETDEAISISNFDKKRYVNTGFLNYKDGIQLLKYSNVSVIIDVRKSAMGTKFYDYVFINKPLLYLGREKTQLDLLVKEFKNGFSCYDEYDVVEAIKKIKKENLTVLTDRGSAQDYSRSKQNQKYVKLMKEICN